jgi:tRNA(Ser,Leu) C12 N-acetylase TAN1
MEDWNVVVTLREGDFANTCEILKELGKVARTDYYNVLAMRVEDVAAFPDEQWLPELAGKSFHVRMHRRGFKGRISSQHEERFLDEILLTSLDKHGAPGRISFDDPDVIIDLETIGQRAGLSMWTRAQRLRYPLLKLD